MTTRFPWVPPPVGAPDQNLRPGHASSTPMPTKKAHMPRVDASESGCFPRSVSLGDQATGHRTKQDGDRRPEEPAAVRKHPTECLTEHPDHEPPSGPDQSSRPGPSTLGGHQPEEGDAHEVRPSGIELRVWSRPSMIHRTPKEMRRRRRAPGRAPGWQTPRPGRPKRPGSSGRCGPSSTRWRGPFPGIGSPAVGGRLRLGTRP
jgi:hypothetical protein